MNRDLDPGPAVIRNLFEENLKPFLAKQAQRDKKFFARHRETVNEVLALRALVIELTSIVKLHTAEIDRLKLEVKQWQK